jgi:3-isopropylmalate/(R)-2-methylmalate dehydratase small subunit
VELAASDCEAIAQAGEAQVDLAAQEVRWPGAAAHFDIDPEIKHRLLNGLDDIALTLEQESKIAAYEAERERPGPVTTAL